MIDSLLIEDGKISNNISAYQPPADVVELTFAVKKAYQDGDALLNQPFEEFNNRSVIERMNEDQRAWLSWTPDPYEGEDDWRWNGVRPITRNRVISTAAHLTSRLIIPKAYAQNSNQEEDRQAQQVMGDLLEHTIVNSNYDTAFLFGVIASLVNPVSYFKQDYTQAWQDMWQEDKRERVVDDVLSGIQNTLVPVENVMISNVYQFEMQKQDWIVEKDEISYEEALAECGEHENFVHVQAGKRVILSDDGIFYDVEDVNSDLVEKIVYKHRRGDAEIKFMGGVYLGSPNVDYNPFVYRTSKNKPEYNIVKSGYEPIDAMRFYYYKSLVAKMSNDQEAADREWQMYFDATFLATFPPTITMGAGKIDRSVIAPATNTDIAPDAKITPLNVSNPNFALGALREAERSINESSQDPQLSGQQQGPQKTARESVLLQQNADTSLGLTSKMIAKMVKEIGEMTVNNIIRYQTIGEAGELVGDMAYKTFILQGKVKDGKKKTSYIRFTDKYAGKKMSKEEKKRAEYKLLEEVGDDKDIYEVNPRVFSNLDFFIRIDAEQMLQRNEAFERAFKLETYDRAMNNPLVQQDQEAQQKITRDFLFEPLMGGEASSYLPNIEKISQVAQQLTPKSKGKGLAEKVVESSATQGLSINSQ